MLTKQELLSFLEENVEPELAPQEIASLMKVRDLDFLIELLGQLEKEGLVVRGRHRRYAACRRMGLVCGRIQGNPRGYAFMIREDGSGEDLFIPEEDLKGAIHGDRVLVRYLGPGSGRRSQGEVVQILNRGHTRIVGTVVEKTRRYAWVKADDRHISSSVFVPLDKHTKARVNDKVIVEITRWPERHQDLEGRISEIIGSSHEPASVMRALIRSFELPEEFSRRVRREAAAITQVVEDKALEGRMDLRNWELVTIDGEDAKDLDDAVSLSLNPEGYYQLGVHIADVSYYVKSGTALDSEARKRGTSVYFPDRVLPMLPPELSNGICSLNAGQDRLAVSALMDIDREGNLVNYRLVRSVIRVRRRLSYNEVSGVLEGTGDADRSQYGPLADTLKLMGKLALILRRARLRQGALDFDFPEVKVELDQTGHCIGLKPVVRTLAHQIIEEFMIKANRVVAEHLHWLDIPLLYRVHEKPSQGAIEELNQLLGPLGYHLRWRSGLEPAQIQQLLLKSKDKPEERLISTAVLRAMQHARYCPQDLGHFGLACDLYCHFTSPIRRYPDLLVHRILVKMLNEGFSADECRDLARTLISEGDHASERERVAEEAERAAVDLKKLEYMTGFIGKVFHGIVAGVTSFGLFVELPNTVQGLIHVSTLDDDYYDFVPNQLALIGQKTGKIYRLGMPVKVLLTKVDVEARQLDLSLVDRL